MTQESGEAPTVETVETSVEAGPCCGPSQSEVSVSPDDSQFVQSDEQVLGTSSEESKYPEEFLEWVKKHEFDLGTPMGRSAWDLAWREWKKGYDESLARGMQEEDSKEEEQKDEDFVDDDGAICFENQSGESRRVRTVREVEKPSKEMIRRHRASGHCPYKPWCACCVQGAANHPGHRPRGEPLMDVPEVHSDYAFLRDKRGDKENTATIMVQRHRKPGAYGANVVPKKYLRAVF